MAGSRTRYAKTVDRISNIDLCVPRIHRAKLHPAYDIVLTGGPMGSHYLFEFTGLPTKLEEYTDEQVHELLRRLIVPAHEIFELRELEIMLRQANPSYRDLTPA
jgi:hypothetical protein